MQKLRRLAVIALGALIGLGAVVLLGVNLYVQSQGAQGKIQQELTRSLGVPLKIRSMSVTPWGGLELSGITIPQTVSVGPKDFLKARTFRLRVRFLSLFSRRLVIKEVSLVAPRLFGRRTQKENGVCLMRKHARRNRFRQIRLQRPRRPTQEWDSFKLTLPPL